MSIFWWTQDLASGIAAMFKVRRRVEPDMSVPFHRKRSYPRGSLTVSLIPLIGQDWLGKQGAGFYDWFRVLDPSLSCFLDLGMLSLTPLSKHPKRVLLARKMGNSQNLPQTPLPRSRYLLLTHKFESTNFFLSEALSHSRFGTIWWKFPGRRELWGLLWF